MKPISGGWKGTAVLDLEIEFQLHRNSAQKRNKLDQCFVCFEGELRGLIAVHADGCVVDPGVASFVGDHAYQICAFTD